MFSRTHPAPNPNLSFHTFGSQDAFDLLQEGLVHERWGGTTHSQGGVLTVYVEHYDVVARPCWEREATEFLSGLDKAMPFTFPHFISPVACGGRKGLSEGEHGGCGSPVKGTDATLRGSHCRGCAVSTPVRDEASTSSPLHDDQLVKSCLLAGHEASKYLGSLGPCPDAELKTTR